MSIAFQNLLTPSSSLLNPYLKTPNSFLPITSPHLTFPPAVLHFRTRNFLSLSSHHPSSHSFIKAYDSGSSIATSSDQNPTFDSINLDSFLSAAELFCIFSSAVVSVVYVVSDWKGVVLGGVWRRVMAWNTAALAQKNSEATRALAAQEEILEKELEEIQKVLLAMQEQQQKQLELILAIAKSGKLFEDKREPSQEKDTVEACKSTEEAKQMEVNQTRPLGTTRGSGNDRT
ncbi:hypothetical protein GOBAR_DD06646 [Gossypium barbadense]|nr:hypothetical protein GOBAR_DD06646 [Gossypium barbadense]